MRAPRPVGGGQGGHRDDPFVTTGAARAERGGERISALSESTYGAIYTRPWWDMLASLVNQNFRRLVIWRGCGGHDLRQTVELF
jgi:hypothetical protein